MFALSSYPVSIQIDPNGYRMRPSSREMFDYFAQMIAIYEVEITKIAYNEGYDAGVLATVKVHNAGLTDEATIRNQVLEEAAKIVDDNVQTISDPREMRPRRHGNQYGMEYAAAIRALKSKVE